MPKLMLLQGFAPGNLCSVPNARGGAEVPRTPRDICSISSELIILYIIIHINHLYNYDNFNTFGVGIKYSKPFVRICKHTATRIRIERGCPAEVDYLLVSVSWPSALHCNPCPPHCSPVNVPTPTPATLMDLPSAKTGQQCEISVIQLLVFHQTKYIPIAYIFSPGL